MNMSGFICRVCRSEFDDDKAICTNCGARLSIGMNLDALTKAKLEIYRLEEENKQLKEQIMDLENGFFPDVKSENEKLKRILRVINNLSITEINAGYEIRHFLENQVLGLKELLD
jgi:hypothetical protein